jgi:hypothetical protein
VRSCSWQKSFNATNSVAAAEQIQGYLAFFSADGTTWTNATIAPAMTNAAVTNANYSFNTGTTAIAPDATVYVAWFDDNGSGTEGQWSLLNANFKFEAVPEPSSFLLSLLGIAGLVTRRKR